MPLNVTKEQYLDNQVAFELAMHRVQKQAHREGKKPTFGELLKLAYAEVEREYERNKAIVGYMEQAEREGRELTREEVLKLLHL